MFTISGTAIDQHMVENFSLSLEHLQHMKRTMTLLYTAPNSSTTFYVSELVELLQNMHSRERVLNFGS